MKTKNFVWFLLVALVVVALSACAPALSPASSAQPTVAPKPTIQPDKPLGQLEVLYALGPTILYFDKGIEAAYQDGFQSMQPKEVLLLIENQLLRIKAAYPGVAPGINRAFNDASVFAWNSFLQYRDGMRSVGLGPRQEDVDEIWTAARAFVLARAYMKLKIINFARYLAVGGSEGMNLIPIFMVDPAALCQEIGSKGALYHLCGQGSYTNQQ